MPYFSNDFWAKLIVTLFLLVQLSPAAEKSRPNMILILADDLGYSDLGCFGGEISSPNLDSLAANGLRMTQLYNTARCCSTRASLLTGLHAHEAGVGAMTADNGKPGYRGFLTDRSVTIAQLLQKSGYQTALSGKWHLRGKGNPECLPTKRGFDEFYGHFRAYASFWRPDLYVRLPESGERPHSDKNFYATDSITDHALNFLSRARQKDEPYFLYLAYNAPHFPLHAPKDLIDKYETIYETGWDQIRETRFRQMKKIGITDQSVSQLPPRSIVPKVPNRNRDSKYFGRPVPEWNSLPENRRADLARRMATYAAMVEIMDRNIGRVITDLRENGELENTLLVFLSDNGACAEWDPNGFDNNPYPVNKLYQGDTLAEMGQPGTFHSYGTGWANASNTPFRLYKHYTHEGGISSPCIIHWPEKISRSGEIDRQAAHITDLSATILELGQVSYPESWEGKPVRSLAGISLEPVFKGTPLPERPIFFEHEGNRALRLGKWKIAWTNYTRAWELYDITSDRTELHDLAATHPDKVSELDLLWKKWAKNHFVELQQVPQPAKGMPKIYYLPDSEEEAARQLRKLGGHAFLDLKSGRINEINLNRNRLTNDATMELVAVCREITDLSLEHTPVGDAGIEKISDFRKLEWLNLYQTRITDQGLKHIAKLPNLEHLPIGETAVTDQGLAQLSALTKLQYLGLRGNGITDLGVSHLESLASLTGLHLGSTGITDRSISSLEKMIELERLWLSDTPVTGTAVESLLTKLPGLREIHLQRTHLRIDQVRRLRTAFPRVEIHYETN